MEEPRKRNSRAASYGIITIILIASIVMISPDTIPLGRYGLIGSIITFIVVVNPFVSFFGIIIGIKQLQEKDKFGWVTLLLSLMSVLFAIYHIANALDHFS